MERPPVKLLDQVRNVCRVRHYSIRTEKAYVNWIKQFILFHQKQHPKELGADHIRQFLTHLARNRKVATSTQNQALNALVFLYKRILQQGLPAIGPFDRAQRPKRLPVVLTKEEVHAVLAHWEGTPRLIVARLYGAGLRLLEALRLRVKDLDFDYAQITVRSGKGDKDRRTLLPDPLREPLRRQLRKATVLHEEDLEAGFGAVYLPDALAAKYPNASTAWNWQYVFPAIVHDTLAPKCQNRRFTLAYLSS